MALRPTPPAPKVELTTIQWEEKLRDIATMYAVRHHHRSSDMWEFYTPEAEHHMSKTYTKAPETNWAITEKEASE